MPEILIRGIADEARTGFKLACTSVGVSMQDSLKMLIQSGYDYYEFGILIDRMLPKEVSKNEWSDKVNDLVAGKDLTCDRIMLEKFRNALTFYELVFTRTREQGQNLRLKPYPSTLTDTNEPDFTSTVLFKIWDIKQYVSNLLSLNASETSELD